jgi:hypothetical protein
MDPERWQQIDQLFHSALKCEPAARAAFLQASIEDEALRHEVESLVESHEQSDSFIEAPATDLAAELLAETEEVLAAGQAVGPYKIVSLLGEGGMGEVYLARDERLGRQVALKLLPAQFTRDADRVQRFEQEAPVPLRRYARVPSGLERIVTKALRKTRDERYQTANDLARDLKTLK